MSTGTGIGTEWLDAIERDAKALKEKYAQYKALPPYQDVLRVADAVLELTGLVRGMAMPVDKCGGERERG